MERLPPPYAAAMDRHQRARLLLALSQRYPWATDARWGPRAVEAGECDSCGAEPRLVLTCGPGPEVFLGRRCAAQAGAQGWCAGHDDEAATALAWLEELPAEADTVARLYWVATGEVGVAREQVDRDLRALALPPP